MRRLTRTWLFGFALGLALVSGAVAGVGVGPVADTDLTGGGNPAEPAGATAAGPLPSPSPLPPGQFLAGANATSIAPGSQWQTVDCFALEDFNPNVDHALPSGGDSWPLASPDCVYLGGFDIGPVRPAESVDDGGVWVRSLAISNGTKIFVYQIIDAVGFFYRYMNGVCSDCGIHDMRNAIASANPGMSAQDVVIASTHSHAGADFYGGWGGIPNWYAAQVRDAVISSAQAAIDAMEPATISVGEGYLKNFNNERRDHYYSNVDEQAIWVQAKDAGGAVIATLANYAGHPTIVSERVLHADWPGAAARRFESLYGGVGLLIEGGLGNVSVRGKGSGSQDARAEATGRQFAEAVAARIDAGRGITLASNEMEADVRVISHPVMTNAGLAALGTAGFFTREFTPGSPGADGPGAYHWSKDRNPDRPGFLRGCDSSSAIQIKTPVGAHQIGELGLFFGPGEIFSNIAETAKAKSQNAKVVGAFGNANDSLGYIIQSFEFDRTTSVATEYGTQTAEYEEVFSIDHCFGDHVLQEMLDAGGALGL